MNNLTWYFEVGCPKKILIKENKKRRLNDQIIHEGIELQASVV